MVGAAVGSGLGGDVSPGSEGPQAETRRTVESATADSDETAGGRRVRRGEWLIIGLTTPGWLGGASGWALEMTEELGSGLVAGAEQPEDG